MSDDFAPAWRTVLRLVQRSNACAETGRACRATQRCGCWLEAFDELRVELDIPRPDAEG